MKLKKILSYDFVVAFEELLTTDYERLLFVASLRNYCSHGNILRFHNFAFSMRELVLHVINRKAPDENVKKASWYTREDDNYEVTRRQKLKYCSQGMLSDGYLNPIVLETTNEQIAEFLKRFSFFNKYTHITEKHLMASPKEFFAEMKEVLELSAEVIKGIESLEDQVKESLVERVKEPIFDRVINATPDDLLILANRVLLDEVSPEELELEYFADDGIVATVEGSVYVSQQYGPHDDLTSISSAYPFTVSVNASLEYPDDVTVDHDSFSVDTSSWFE